MRKGLLLGIAGIAAAVGTPNVRAACIPTQDCVELGYKYTSSECAGDRIACPFDTSKFFCFEPQICNYSYTAASCSSQCKSVGSTSCVKDGTTYYSSCGSSLCSSGQTCNNGTCESSMTGQYYYCCDSSYCSSYSYCMQYYSDCSSYHTKCRNGGGTPFFQVCYGGNPGYLASFACL